MPTKKRKEEVYQQVLEAFVKNVASETPDGIAVISFRTTNDGDEVIELYNACSPRHIIRAASAFLEGLVASKKDGSLANVLPDRHPFGEKEMSAIENVIAFLNELSGDQKVDTVVDTLVIDDDGKDENGNNTKH